MADFAAITAILQRMGLENVEHNHHELRFEYPVLDLLDSDDEEFFPVLPYPENAGYRAKPASSRPHLADSGTDFFIRIPLRDGNASDFSPCTIPKLFTTIQQLGNVRGYSVLQIAISEGKYPTPTYHFRLITDCEGMREQMYECTLTEPVLGQVLASYQSAEWMQMMLGLINRSSDRAYFHVHERLRHYPWYQSQTERYEMDMKWDQEDLKKATQLLATSLRHARWDS